jgi:hypothetical protein
MLIVRLGLLEIVSMTASPVGLNLHEMAYQLHFFRLSHPPHTKMIRAQAWALTAALAMIVTIQVVS